MRAKNWEKGGDVVDQCCPGAGLDRGEYTSGVVVTMFFCQFKDHVFEAIWFKSM